MHFFIIKKNTIIRILVFCLLIGVTFVYTNSILKRDAQVSSQNQKQMPIISVRSNDMVAITIDTSFGDDYTSEILKILEQNEVSATFFIMGAWATKYPASTKLISLSDNQIANHSMSHERYTDLSARDILSDANACKDYLYNNFNVQTDYIRMPYGAFDDESLYTLKGEGFIPVKWSLDSKDWKTSDSDKIISTINQNSRPGDIILFQSNSEQTVLALDTVIKDLKKKGLKPVTLEQMIPEGEVYIDSRGVLEQLK